MSLHRLIPDPFGSDESHARFTHADIGDLSPSELWAETLTIEAELARRIARRIRPWPLTAWPTAVSDREWMIDRLRALRGEMRRRGYADPDPGKHRG